MFVVILTIFCGRSIYDGGKKFARNSLRALSALLYSVDVIRKMTMRTLMYHIPPLSIREPLKIHEKQKKYWLINLEDTSASYFIIEQILLF